MFRKVLLAGLTAAVLGATALASATPAAAGYYDRGYGYGYGPPPPPAYGYYGPRRHWGRGHGPRHWGYRPAPPPYAYGHGYGWR